jgi:hypothetical protein
MGLLLVQRNVRLGDQDVMRIAVVGMNGRRGCLVQYHVMGNVGMGMLLVMRNVIQDQDVRV